MKSPSPGTFRFEARAAILRIIEEHVHGPVQLLPKGDILELRKILRQKYPYDFSIYSRRIWRQEIRSALGYPDPKPRKRGKKPFRIPARNVMPSMRDWAAARGVLAD